MQREQEQYTYDDGFGEVTLVEGGSYRIPLSSYKYVLDAWVAGVWKILTFVDVAGATINVRADRIEGVIAQTPASIAERNRIDEASAPTKLPFDL